MNAKQVWQSALERIQPKISPATFSTWFTGTSGVALEDHLLIVRVRNTFSRAHLESRFYDLICSVLYDLVGSDAQVRFEVGQGDDWDDPAPGGMASAQVVDSVAPRQLQGLPLEEASASEPPVSHRPPALMTVAAARRERFEVAQEGRRAPRRTSSYAAPELLSFADAPVATPLLTHLLPISSAPVEEVAAAAPPAPRLEEERASPPIEECASPIIVESVRTPSVLAAAEPAKADDTPAPRSAPALWPRPKLSSQPGAAGNRASGLLTGSEVVLNPRYTFNTFMVGKSNLLAHASSSGITEKSGDGYNPLLLWSNVGLGKTHLLHAIGHAGLAAGLNVLYTTADRFTNEIINAIRYHTTEEFRAKYRQIDILLVDDIQFIAGKESTEEEFFHTFNTLHNANKQIVLTSDRPPKAMVTLQDRLRSRFEWGLMADIQPPEYELRLAILGSKAEYISGAEGQGIDIPDAVIEYIARPDCASVRELEGALNRVVAYAKLRGVPITMELAQETLERLRTENKHRVLTTAQVLEVVARHYNVTLEALRGKQRDREIAWPRQVAMLMMREETRANLIQIAAELGGRDHSTIIYGANRVNEAINTNERVRKELAVLREELRILALQQEIYED